MERPITSNIEDNINLPNLIRSLYPEPMVCGCLDQQTALVSFRIELLTGEHSIQPVRFQGLQAGRAPGSIQ